MYYLKRISLIVTVASIALWTVGCGGNQGGGQGNAVPNGTPALLADTVQPAKGGHFSASYAGTFVGRACGAHRGGHFNFEGNGEAEYFGSSTESGALHGAKYRGEALCAWSSWNATLVSEANRHDYIVLNLYLGDGGVDTPCNKRVAWSMRYGNGKFNGANGAGKVTFTCTGSGYVDRWTGRLTFSR